MSHKTPALLVIGLCAFTSWSVAAQTGIGRITDKVAAMDKNFDAADTSRDGLLSKDEAKAGHVPFIIRNFDRIDTQHRGHVSKDDVHEFIKKSLMDMQPPPAPSSSAS
jgi:hypothetical protein